MKCEEGCEVKTWRSWVVQWRATRGMETQKYPDMAPSEDWKSSMHSYMDWQRRLSVYPKMSCLELKLVLKRMHRTTAWQPRLNGCICAPKEVEPMSMFRGLFDGSHHQASSGCNKKLEGE